jgi:hypothetical protein
VQIYELLADGGETVPDYSTRKKIEKQVTKTAYEHLIIFTDAAQTVQIWQWVARAPGKPDAYRETTHHPGPQSGDLLLQKLQSIRFTLDEEESIDIAGASHRLRDAFDRDTVTKKFYKRFKEEQQAFLGFIEGLTNEADRKWYASLMLNRLMFVWFIQEKGFLDGHKSYLQDRLARVRERKGKGKFHTFYRYFLLALFHEGFGKRKHDRKLDRDLTELLGRVPYLNGGLFDPHKIEQNNDGIQIPDDAFERLFAFFGEYDWHLDTRTISQGNEINPDVLGYIFEKYINQKQMGAYYTKEDITEYTSKNRILPFLFDAARKKCKVAFQSGSALWRVLQEDPYAFIYRAMRKGVVDDDGNVIPLPPEIEKGVDTSKPKLLERRKGWNAKAEKAYALPTEIWREHVARRQRCLEIREKLRNGEVHDINDLITYNLDIRQFAERAISECEGPELLRAFWQSVRSVTILDPTCGSGAFLFAALEILFPLYEACLTRMQGFVEDLDRSGTKYSPKKFSDFRDVLDDIDRHPSHDYFILKSIIVHNLYGVDIMPEAVEICKLRLFLKLVAQVANVNQLEPLPDIDFNIRAGNTLVGFTSMDEIRRSVDGDWIKEAELPELEEQAQIASRAYAAFHEMQTKQGMDSREFTEAKQALRERLTAIDGRLNVYLASAEYGINVETSKKLEEWVTSHQPFHWFVEFYRIVASGGFDVIIGNPPYLERSKLCGAYKIYGFETESCRDIYSWVTERAFHLRHRQGRLGLIVPVSLASSGSFNVLRDIVETQSRLLWLSHFANRPGQLFVGAQNRLTIVLSAADGPCQASYSTRYHRWDARNGERDSLFAVMQYEGLGDLSRAFHGLYPKVGDPESAEVLRKIRASKPLGFVLRKQSQHPVVWVRVPGYFCQFFLDPPKARPEKGGRARPRGELISIRAEDEVTQRLLHALLNSSTYFQFFYAYTDGRHINPSDVTEFPFDFHQFSKKVLTRLNDLSRRLEESMRENTSQWRKSGLLIDSVDSRRTKPAIDKIDAVLAEHYGLTDEELDFIINYDIKYRMGDSLATSDGD